MKEIVFTITVHELCEHQGLNEELIAAMVEHGIAAPFKGRDVAEWVFDAGNVYWLKKAGRLYHDLEIDWVAVAMVIDLLRQKEALEKKSAYYEQQLKRFLVP